MPTGYTSELYDGKKVSFEKFVMGCARAFGACVTMRDDDPSVPIPNKFKPSDYHVKEISKAKTALASAEKWSHKKAEKLSLVKFRAEMKEYYEDQDKDEARGRRYKDMISDVQKWEPPTEDHKELRKFMLEQLTESLRFDCGHDRDKPSLKTGEQFRASVMEKAIQDIVYHTEENRKEIERVNKRNAWIESLRQSLNRRPAEGAGGLDAGA